jgi:hypothetical protein
VLSLLGALLGTYYGPATDMKTLKEFYINVRPWGFWKPVIEEVKKDNPDIQENKNFSMDMFNVLLGTIAQTALVTLPIYLVLRHSIGVGVTLAIIIVIGIIMKKTWWDKLETKL